MIPSRDPFVRRSTAFVLAAFLLLQQLIFVIPAGAAAPAYFISPDLVISQVYGGGGNSGAPFNSDFVEIFNRGTSPVSLADLSIQYTSATGTGNFGANAGQITELPNVILNPGQYYLVQQSGGAAGGPLPPPDHIDPTPINMAAGAGKVALVDGQTGLGCNGGSTPCSPAQLARIIDLVGYGNANFFEGTAAAPTLSNTTSAFRVSGGCQDTDDNAADFTSGAPAPRNTSSPFNTCGAPIPTDPTGIGAADPSSIEAGESSLLTVAVTPGQNPTSTGLAVTADLAPIGGSSAQQFFDDGTNGDVAANDGIFSFFATSDASTTPGVKTLNVTITDAQSRTGNTSISLNIQAPPGPETVVISQVYGGGGNAGTFYTNDFIELFNYGSSPVNLAGWSVQYNSAAGSGTWQVTPLSGTIAPGGYILVQQAAGAGGQEPLPTPDVIGSIAMAAGAGKVALRSTATAATGACPLDWVDLVGYGATATCSEGGQPTGNLSNTAAALRKRGGCFDSNNNALDFTVGSPTPRNSQNPLRSCNFLPLPINQIQGPGLQTPYLNQDVQTTGIVTGIKSNGFFMQEPDSSVDSDPNTSEGIFVFTTSSPFTPVSVGDSVTVQGTATEFFDLTQIEASLPGEVVVNSSGNPLPAPIVLTQAILDPNGSITQLERFEGMRVTVDSVISVAPTNNFGEIWTVLSGVPRPMREPGITAGLPIPPDPVTGIVDCCIPIWDRNPERIMIDTDGLAGSTRVNVTSNVTLSGITGPLDFNFNDYKINPETAPVVESANMSAVPVPELEAGEFTIGSYNIQNFSGNPTQRQKAALAIRNVLRSPDILGVIEIASLAALQDLADQINQDTVNDGGSNPGYEARLIPTPNGFGGQNVGFLVKTANVEINSVSQELAGDTFINPTTGQPEFLHDRPPMVLHATVNRHTDPRPVIVVVNHTRSFIDVEALTPTGVRVREKRKAQGESIAVLLQDLQTNNPTTPVVAVGDYNAYQFSDGYTDPVATIKGQAVSTDNVVVSGSPDLVEPDLVNLTDTLPADQQYSYIFEGSPQAIDHVFVNHVASPLVTRYAVARLNADFPSTPEFNAPDRPENSSDHDAPVAFFRFPAAVTSTEVPNFSVTYNVGGQMVALTANVAGPTNAINEGTVTFTVTDTGGTTVIGTAGPAPVVNGTATADLFLPGSVLPQGLVVNAEFSGGSYTLPSSGTGTLKIGFAVCLNYDPTKVVKSGAAYPIKLRLCDADGVNVSNSSTILTATGITLASDPSVQYPVQSPGNSQPGNRFKFTSNSYQFNLKTTGLSAGSYHLNFTAGDDPVIHTAGFAVR
ncbi:MAG TPA: lamin tail domain-containing protein [Pyrinomonadaceae bacterium]|nr:lamin tail domain-containing protein [Pyrinomonadaceae bacterium]HMP66687.1 lamin tail domain-containing protein [Pyrinomonadaceae bacterium]